MRETLLNQWGCKMDFEKAWKEFGDELKNSRTYGLQNTHSSYKLAHISDEDQITILDTIFGIFVRIQLKLEKEELCHLKKEPVKG